MSKFLFRPAPIEGESMSSWRQRLGIANGFTLFPLAPSELRRSDFDHAPSVQTLDWLSEASGYSSSHLRALTVRESAKDILEGIATQSPRPRWIVPLQYSRREGVVGIPFCPHCLAEDTEPYFRLRWRFAFTASCMIHGRVLQHGCEACGSPVWPTVSTRTQSFKTAQSPLHSCVVCRRDLRRRSAVALDSGLESQVSFFSADALEVDLGTRVVATREFLQAAWILGALFRGRATRSRIMAGEDSFAVECSALPQSVALELLPVESRARLLVALNKLFVDWPKSLLKFCQSHGIKALHFSEYRVDMPKWFHDDILPEIQERDWNGVSAEDFDRAVERVNDSGRMPTRYSICRILGRTESVYVDRALAPKRQANAAEAEQFIDSLEDYLQEVSTHPATRFAAPRNAAALLLAIHEQAPITSVLQFDAERCEVILRGHRHYGVVSPAVARFQALLCRLVGDLLEHARADSSSHTQSGKSPFRPWRGKSVRPHAVTTLLRRCMASLPWQIPRRYSSLQVLRTSAR